MPATPCRYRGCPNLVTSRLMKGYCDAHAQYRYGWQVRQQRDSVTKRGYGHAWRKLRLQALERDGYLCVACKANGKVVEANEVDHIINKANGGLDIIDNLQSLCRKCHKKKTQAESGRAGKKFGAANNMTAAPLKFLRPQN